MGAFWWVSADDYRGMEEASVLGNSTVLRLDREICYLNGIRPKRTLSYVSLKRVLGPTKFNAFHVPS